MHTLQQPKTYSSFFTDFLVIGSGIAGLRVAIELSNYGKVLIVTKDEISESNTGHAQGGIAVVFAEDDCPQLHFNDTIKAGDGLCNEKAVKILVQEGTKYVKELISWGMEFDKKNDKFLFAREAAHSKNRIMRARGDATGEEILKSLLKKVNSIKNIKFRDFAFTTDLIIEDGICRGIIFLDIKKEIISKYYAKTTILATGGAGQIFQETSNPRVAAGDGIAIAYRAGVQLEDMEFIQFHPTTLFLPSTPRFLISETVRGEGGILRNSKGEAFMHRYHPSGDLAPRDIASHSIIIEMKQTKSENVFLDVTHLKASFIRKRFPQIYKTCKKYGIDITKEFIPVHPSAHYIMGGIKTNVYGETNIEGLYACGEVTCTEVHGANRLASNSLLEGIVFGARVGKSVSKYAQKIKSIPLISPIKEQPKTLREKIPNVNKISNFLRTLMWTKVGIIRNKKQLLEAQRGINNLSQLLKETFFTYRELELQNMITVSRLIVKAALIREESRGAHFRSDFPEKNDQIWGKHIVLKKGIGGEIVII